MMSSCSLLSRLVHRGVVSGCGGGRHRHMLEATTIMTVVPATTNHYYFSTYADDKLAAKELRRQQFEQRLARVEHLKTRRDGRPTEVKKTEFKTWYDKRRTYHEIMDRKARQEGLPWKIQVAAVVERLPLILPVREKWEQDYVDLRKHLNQFTWDYPNELARLDKKVEESEDIDGECWCELAYFCPVCDVGHSSPRQVVFPIEPKFPTLCAVYCRCYSECGT